MPKEGQPVRIKLIFGGSFIRPTYVQKFEIEISEIFEI